MARTALEQAVVADPENWLPHDLLADTYLHEKSYEKARDEAQVAIARGKNAASSAQLTFGQALINLGSPRRGFRPSIFFYRNRRNIQWQGKFAISSRRYRTTIRPRNNAKLKLKPNPGFPGSTLC